MTTQSFQEKKTRIVIFANGILDDPATEAVRWIRPGDLVVAADGGTKCALAAGVTPTHVIGDLDSLSPEQRAQLETAGTIIHAHPPAKDETDLELALLWAAAQPDVTEIVVLGALGGRPDQELANLLLLALPQLAGRDVIVADGRVDNPLPAWQRNADDHRPTRRHRLPHPARRRRRWRHDTRLGISASRRNTALWRRTRRQQRTRRQSGDSHRSVRGCCGSFIKTRSWILEARNSIRDGSRAFLPQFVARYIRRLVVKKLCTVVCSVCVVSWMRRADAGRPPRAAGDGLRQLQRQRGRHRGF